MKYKKGQANDTTIVMTIVAFQSFIIIGLAFLEITSESQTVGGLGYTQNIVTNISLLGWGNLIVFAPLLVGIGYIVSKLLRGGG